MPEQEQTIAGLLSKVQLPSGDVYSIKDSSATTVSVSSTTGTNGNTLYIVTPVTNGDEVNY